MPLPLYQIDAFADRPFAGNPAAVVLLDSPREEQWMQAVAAEMNLSETAFVRPLGEDETPGGAGDTSGGGSGGGGFELRWFTPAAEVELCGHATLASAHVLWETARLAPDQPARFHTRYRGLLTASRSGGWIDMDFPADPPTPADPPPGPPGLLDRLGLAEPDVLAVSRSRYDWVVEVADEHILAALNPDFPALAKFDCRGIAVTSRITEPSGGTFHADVDFVSRFFAPRLRINEDPVTGSAHCVLGPYWADRLHKQEMLAYQASPRGGTVRLRLRGPRIILGGQAITILRGELAY